MKRCAVQALVPGLLLWVVLVFSQWQMAWAENPVQLQLVVTGSSRAIVIFNGERLVLRVGDDRHPNVRLVSADSERAVLNVDGKEVALETDRIAAPILQDDRYADDDPGTEEEPAVVTLWAEPSGFFFANGSVNRRGTRFLVDTGANTVTLSGAQADRLGIEYRNGRDGYAATASGVTPIKSIILKRVTVEGITLRNIAANVVPGRFPEYPLLGASFLGKLNMVRSGNKMELSRR